jgi:type II pantothenate kinase
VISSGTGTACVYHNEGQFNHLGGISVGGGTFKDCQSIINWA